MYFHFADTFEKIDVSRIHEKFYFGPFMKPNILSYLNNSVRHLTEMKMMYVNVDDDVEGITNSLSNIPSHYISHDDMLIHDEVEVIYNNFKKTLKDSQDKKTLRVLERWNGIKKDKELYSKAGYNSQPAFFYQKEKLKKQFVNYMVTEYDYDITLS
jgi:transposase-like protein